MVFVKIHGQCHRWTETFAFNIEIPWDQFLNRINVIFHLITRYFSKFTAIFRKQKSTKEFVNRIVRHLQTCQENHLQRGCRFSFGFHFCNNLSLQSSVREYFVIVLYQLLLLWVFKSMIYFVQKNLEILLSYKNIMQKMNITNFKNIKMSYLDD